MVWPKKWAAQCWFKWLSCVEIIAAVSIPLIAGFAQPLFPAMPVVAILGALIAVISAGISLNQFQESWTEYRTTCESLKHEKYLFLTKVESYIEENPYSLFVQRIENIISKEIRAWLPCTQVDIDSIDNYGSKN